MKQQLETATEAPPESQSHDGADSTPGVLTEPELFKTNDAGLEARGVAVSVLERQAGAKAPRRFAGAAAAMDKAAGHDALGAGWVLGRNTPDVGNSQNNTFRRPS
jgi:hypothetical protein